MNKQKKKKNIDTLLCIIIMFYLFAKTNFKRMKETILQLLETKFQGARKDGLNLLAGVLAMTATDEETAQKVVDSLTADQVKNFITDFRKGADAEITKATKTAEENLRAKYNFVDKNAEPPKPETEPGKPNFEELIKKALEPYTKEIADLKGQTIKNQRKEKFSKAIETAPDTLKSILIENFENSNFETENDFEEYLKSKSEQAQKLNQDFNNAKLGAMAKPGQSNINPSDVSVGMREYVKQKQKK